MRMYKRFGARKSSIEIGVELQSYRQRGCPADQRKFRSGRQPCAEPVPEPKKANKRRSPLKPKPTSPGQLALSVVACDPPASHIDFAGRVLD